MDKLLECKVVKIENGESSCISELVVCEYPLTIYLNGKKIATLLCSPEKLKELTLGFLSTEGIIESLEDIKYFKLDDVKALVEVETFDKSVFRKSFYSKKVELDNIKDNNIKDFTNFLQCVDCTPVVSKITLKANKVFEFMKKNLDFSEIFKKTGGLHCVALSDTEDIIIISEDVARHNALDKVVGEGLLKKTFFKDKILILSGRVSLEMLLKAAKLQIPVIISKSAPTSLSVSLAKKLNITLVGFVRGNKMNIYSGEERIIY